MCLTQMATVQQVDGQASETGVGVSEDELFDVLSNKRRRFAVHLLKREEEGVEIGRMAEQIAAWENDIGMAEISGTERKRVYTALQQSHLPKMDRAGVVEFDKARGTIEPTPALDAVDLYLDVVEESEIPWNEYYLGLSAVGAVLVVAVWMEVWPFVLLPDLAWTLAFVLAFGFSALVHKYYTTHLEVGSTEKPPELR